MKMNPMQSQSSKYEYFILISEISAALWVHIRTFEITFRTFVHRTLSEAYNSSQWWLIEKLLASKDLRDFQYVEKRLLTQKRAVTPLLVAHNMSFSFWIELCSARYYEKVWRRFEVANPVLKDRRRDFYKKAREIRNLRNLIAHHAPIMRRNLLRDHAYLHELTALLDSELAEEVQKRSRVLNQLLNARLVGSGGGI